MKKHIVPIPEECADMQIMVQSSDCTGEKTIGFYDSVNHKLLYAELVKSEKDIEKFYERYGVNR